MEDEVENPFVQAGREREDRINHDRGDSFGHAFSMWSLLDASVRAFYLENFIAASLCETQATILFGQKLLKMGVDGHTLVKFTRKGIPCTCLGEKHEEVKSITKVDFCCNPSVNYLV